MTAMAAYNFLATAAPVRMLVISSVDPVPWLRTVSPIKVVPVFFLY